MVAACNGQDRIMDLHLPTLMVMEAFVPACAGAVLFTAWLYDRKILVLGLWGLANLVAAGGVFSLPARKRAGFGDNVRPRPF